MTQTIDLVPAITVDELREALDTISRISHYLPRSISSQLPNITTLLFALHEILKEKNARGLEEPVVILYHPETKLFMSSNEIDGRNDDAFIDAVTVLPTGRMIFHNVLL